MLLELDLIREAYNELIKLSPSEVYIIGGEESISKSLDRSLEELGVKVKRISGKSRYETSQKVYDEIDLKSLLFWLMQIVLPMLQQ